MKIDKNEFRKFSVVHCHVPSAGVDQLIATVERCAIPQAFTPYITVVRDMRV